MELHVRKLHTRDRRKLARAAHHRVLRKAYQQPNSACVQRVLRLIQLMREAESLRLQLYERQVGIESDPRTAAKYEQEVVLGSFSDPELQALNVAFNDRLKKIEEQMKRYRWTPTVRASEFFGLNQMFIWGGRRDSDKFWENLAVFWLMGHISGSGLSPASILRFRQCRRCSKWFYALTDHQAYCSAKCRQKDHADSPEFRKKRAEYMKQIYRPRESEAKREDEKRRKDEAARERASRAARLNAIRDLEAARIRKIRGRG